MLPKVKRLIRHDIIKLLKKNHPFHSPTFTLRVAPASRVKSSPKVAVTVSSKVLKRATERNKLRRRIYSILKNLYPTLKTGVIFQLLVRKPAVTLSYQELDLTLKQLLKKAGLV